MNHTERSMQLEAGGSSPPRFTPWATGAGTTTRALHSPWLQETYAGIYSSRHAPSNRETFLPRSSATRQNTRCEGLAMEVVPLRLSEVVKW